MLSGQKTGPTVLGVIPTEAQALQGPLAQIRDGQSRAVGFPEELTYVGSLLPTVYSAMGTELSTASFIAIKDTEHSSKRCVCS